MVAMILRLFLSCSVRESVLSCYRLAVESCLEYCRGSTTTVDHFAALRFAHFLVDLVFSPICELDLHPVLARMLSLMVPHYYVQRAFTHSNLHINFPVILNWSLQDCASLRNIVTPYAF